jgi:hypothetical protein
MEPIELTLFTRYKNNRPIDVDAPPLAWVLKMPRAFLKFEIGNPDAVHMAGPNCCDHFINLEAVYDPESRNLLPATIASPELRRQSAVGISLANRSQLLEIISGDHCIKEDDFKSFMQQRGNNIDWRRNCDPKAFRCRVYTHLDGWSADFSVPRKFYAESDLFCRVVRDFLKASTIRRDDLGRFGG